MEYAIVDIETTGGSAANSGITEIAIIIHNGKEAIGKYETFINPQRTIPRYIEALTGITNEMIEDAPPFSEVADNIYRLLNGRIFVAHSVNFDYSFLYHHLQKCGYNLQVLKLCTVRMSRKIFPGMYSYSLGKLCHNLDIPISNRHRAGGDAKATVMLFERLLQNDSQQHIATMLKKGSGEQLLPPNLDKKDIEKLPAAPGVYFFKNKFRKTIYIGKAKNLKKRVISHFTGNKPDKRRQDFLREIFYIEHQQCSSELMAMITEVLEIKKLWPKYNYAAKHYEPKFGLFFYEDNTGFYRLAIGRFNKSLLPLKVYFNRDKARKSLYRLIEEYNLCTELCFAGKCENCTDTTCNKTDKDIYNQRVASALKKIQEKQPGVFIQDSNNENYKACIVQEDKYVYIGQIKTGIQIDDIEILKQSLTCYPSSDYVNNMLAKNMLSENTS